MRNDKEILIVKLTLDFALETIQYSKLLKDNRKYVIARQLLKSGTSIGENIREAQNAKSKAVFYKMKIAVKEADETEYWLILCELSDNYLKFNHKGTAIFNNQNFVENHSSI